MYVWRGARLLASPVGLFIIRNKEKPAQPKPRAGADLATLAPSRAVSGVGSALVRPLGRVSGSGRAAPGHGD